VRDPLPPQALTGQAMKRAGAAIEKETEIALLDPMGRRVVLGIRKESAGPENGETHVRRKRSNWLETRKASTGTEAYLYLPRVPRVRPQVTEDGDTHGRRQR
jgi:hypothetical protein